MRAARWMTGLGIGALAAAVTFVAPALQAQENGSAGAKQLKLVRGSLGSFTPAAADPKLAAILARTGMPESGFRFTPAESHQGVGRVLTPPVRTRVSETVRAVERSAVAAAPSVKLAPIAYNLGVSVGWKRFAATSEIAHIDVPAESVGRERVEAPASFTNKRITGRLEAVSNRSFADAPVLIGDKPNYSVDLGGSYKLTRNLDVTAGVRYKSERDRLPVPDADRRESQSVYVGTAFRF